LDNLLKTPLADEYQKYGGKIVDFAGWYMPVEFEGILKEHEAVRTNVGLFDVSHMGEITVKGKDALKFVNYLITNDLEKIIDNQVLYTYLCREDGGIVDDILVYRFGTEDILLVVNASNILKDYEWVLANKGAYEVEIENISGVTAQLALQGPNAEKVLQNFTDTDLSEIKFFFAERNVMIDGFKCMISRTGYTGEDGFEIYLSNEDVVPLYNRLLGVGVKPIGLGARDTLRFESNLPLYGNELSDTVTPIEAGYGFFVKTDKEAFIGKEILAKQKAEGVQRKIVGFTMNEKKIPRHGYKVFKDGNEIGFVTTGYKSPTLDEFIGLALIKSEFSKIGEEIEIEIRGKMAKATVRNRKFIKKENK